MSAGRGGGGGHPRWLAAGVLVGAIGTGLIVALVLAWIRGDAPSEPGPAPLFVDETGTSGVDHVYDGEFQFFVGGGIAVLDCDGDGFQDLYVAGGQNPAGLYRNESGLGGRLVFAAVPARSTDLTSVSGAYPLDVDSDGHTDLAVLRVGENVLLRGRGDCRFERANEIWGFDGGTAWTTAFSATWEEGETLPTLAFGNYLVLDESGASTGECDDHVLVRPSGGRYDAPTRLSPGLCSLSVLFSDWSGLGTTDLRMTNDRHYYREGEDQLWRIEAGRPPRPYSREDGWESLQIWGMGIASHDLTGDGRPEVYLTSQGDNKLQTLTAGGDRPSYEDIALSRGANTPRPFSGDVDRPSTAWHAEFDDVNNDGFIDLFVTKGNVEAMPEFAGRDPNNLLLGQPGATFIEAAGQANLIDYERSRGGAVADLNLDGLLDVVVVDRRESVKTWRNVGEGTADMPVGMGNWLAVDLHQDGPNRDAVGAWVEVRLGNVELRRELTVGGGHAGGEIGWTHFGLGHAEEAAIRVRWPDGEVGPWLAVEANRFFLLDRQAADAVPWPPVQD